MPNVMGEVAPVFISSAIAEQVFDWASAVAAVQTAYSHPYSEKATPPRVVASEGGAVLRALPAAPPGGRYVGAKIMATSNSAPVPGAEYVTVLFDRETSSIAAFLDAALVTGYRTAATTAAAVDKMAPAGAATLGVLGSGLEASMHVRAFAAIRQLTDVAIYSTTPARREGLARTLSEELNIPVRAVNRPEAAVQGASVILSAARSHGEKPILHGGWLRPGTLIVSIGSTMPDQREVDISVIEKTDLIVCDMVDEVLEQTGDLIAAAQAGIDRRVCAFSMNALMRGDLADRLAVARYPLFKSVGGGVQDVIVAAMLLTRALDAGLATTLPMTFVKKTR